VAATGSAKNSSRVFGLGSSAAFPEQSNGISERDLSTMVPLRPELRRSEGRASTAYATALKKHPTAYPYLEFRRSSEIHPFVTVL
jgi:hypothetical protein